MSLQKRQKDIIGCILFAGTQKLPKILVSILLAAITISAVILSSLENSTAVRLYQTIVFLIIAIGLLGYFGIRVVFWLISGFIVLGTMSLKLFNILNITTETNIFCLLGVFLLIFAIFHNNTLNLSFSKQRLVIFLIIIAVGVIHSVWSLISPDAQAYYLVAKNLVDHHTDIIENQFIAYSNNFVRQQFIKMTNTSMITVYPTGSYIIVAWALYLFRDLFWIVFTIMMISIVTIIIKFFVLINKKQPSKLHILLLIFQPLILFPLIAGISVDLIASGLFIYFNFMIYKMVVFKSKELNTAANNIIIISELAIDSFAIAFTKYNILFYTILIGLTYTIYWLVQQNKQNKGDISNRKKLIVAILLILVFIILSANFIVKSTYLKSFNIQHIINAIIQYPFQTIEFFVINTIQILILAPIIVPLLISYSKKIISQKHNVLDVVIITVNLFFFTFIFAWRSYNIYPFDIGGRYYLPIIFLFFILPINRKWLKVAFIYSLIVSTFVIVHAKYIDIQNNKFASEIYNNTPENAIIVTTYYHKIIVERTVYLYEYKNHPLYPPGTIRENVTTDIIKLLNMNFSLYFIPDGKQENVEFIMHSFNMELICSISRLQIFGFLVDYPAERSLYRIVSPSNSALLPCNLY